MLLIPIGTKAQLIKMAPVILAIKEREIPFDFVLTGQHEETMEDLIEGFGLPKPDYFLTPTLEADTSLKLANWLFKTLRKHLSSSSIIARKNYQLCLVHGDTMSTFAGAIIAKRHGISVAHIEAGLRSHNLFHPFPEEITRLAVSKIASIYYCSSSSARSNIEKKHPQADIVDIQQNTLLDSVRIALKKKQNLKKTDDSFYCVVSIHRYENISNEKRFRFIIKTITNISKNIPVKFVLHAATRKKLAKYNMLDSLTQNPHIELIARMDYFNFTNLISRSQYLVSDGGSNQEECSYLEIPCLLMRMHTERNEGLGKNCVLSGYDTRTIEEFCEKHSKPQQTRRILDELQRYSPSEIIADDIKKRLLN